MHEMAEDLKILLMKDVAEVLEKGCIEDYDGLYKAVKTFYYLTIIKEMEEGKNRGAFYEEMISGGMPRYDMRMSGGNSYGSNSYNNPYNGYSGNSYGNSYERGRSPITGRYVSRDNDPMEKLNSMMANAKNDQERDMIRRMMDEFNR